MSRHPHFVPQGVIPAVLLPFHEDLSIDEPSFRAHLRDVGAVQGLSAFLGEGFLYANAHDWARFGEFMRRAENGTANSFCRRVLSITCARPRRRPMKARARSTVADRCGWPGAKDSTSPTTRSCWECTSAK
jgi:CubicO group peptidase (beta-lactamase class C family)